MTPTADGALSVEVRWTLQVGILVAALLLVGGILLTIVHGGTSILAPPTRFSLPAVPGQLIAGTGSAYILLGVLVLVFTPIVRVLVSLLHFARTRDVPFTVITAVVLAVLAISVLVGVSP